MSDFSVIVWFIIGAAVSLFALYLIIRVAVRHALRDARQESGASDVVEQ